MRALVSTGPDSALGFLDLPELPLRPDELRVAVAAIGVNPVDWKLRGPGSLGFLGLAQRALGPAGPLVPGIDFSGRVTEVGAKVQQIKVGDRVVGATDFSRRQRGSYAEMVQVREDQVARLGKDTSFALAAGLPVPGCTAFDALFGVGELRPPSKVLILGASGGVGHLAVQLASGAGAKVFGVCSKANAELVTRLGGRPILYDEGEPFEAARGCGPFDLVLDTVGTHAYPLARWRRVLATGGRYVLVTPTPADFLAIARRQVRTLLGRPRTKTLEKLVAELEAGRLEVLIEARLPLAEAERGHEVSRAGHVRGKVVLIACPELVEEA
ncbi:MAG: NADP-dependent oxidoreductase [Deltaproteobacteria bacterium]|nr:NADP-dependent oxidoreductase [Deltaproteobacteria bacterium]